MQVQYTGTQDLYVKKTRFAKKQNEFFINYGKTEFNNILCN